MTLRIKILAAMALVLAFTVSLSFLVLIRYQRSQLLRNTAEASSHLANTIRATLEHAMLVNDPAEIQHIVLAVGQQSGVEGVFVLNPQAIVKIASDPGQLGRPLPDGPSALPAEAPEGEMGTPRSATVYRRQPFPILRSTSLIPNAPRCQRCHSPTGRILGALVVDRSLQQMEQQLRMNLVYMVGSAAVAFLLLTLTTYAVLRHLVILPLADLGRSAQAIQAGKYDTPLTLQTSDEVGALARTLDQMRRRILEHLEEVRHWGQELEVRVAERTQELQTLNRVALITNEALELEAIFARALEATLEALDAAAGAIILVAPQFEKPMVVQQGFPPAQAETLARKAGEMGVNLACEDGIPYPGRRSFACFPIRSKGVLRGVFCVDSPDQVPLTPEKLRLLEGLAAQLGGTVDRALLHQELERSFRDLQSSQAQIIERERQIAALEAVRGATVTLSHHINNATAGIEGCRTVLATSLAEQADWQVRFALEGIQACVKKITAVLRALQEVTRIELMRFPGGTKAIDVEREIREMLARLEVDG